MNIIGTEKSKVFKELLDGLQMDIYEIAKERGWWEEERDVGTLIALMHSELSEALEAARNNDPADDKITEFSGVEAELADCIIRILDAAEGMHLRIAAALIAKVEYNIGRPYKHGGKLF